MKTVDTPVWIICYQCSKPPQIWVIFQQPPCSVCVLVHGFLRIFLEVYYYLTSLSLEFQFWYLLTLSAQGHSKKSLIRIVNCLGPVLLTEAIMDFCEVGRATGRPIIGHHSDCWNLSVFKHPAFYPLKANQREELFKHGDDDHWRKIFKDSYSVHFFGQLTSTR